MDNQAFVTWLGMVVVEMPTFATDARRLLSEDERHALIDRLAHNPQEGVVIPAGGGVRKTRVGLGSRGKRGGGRVIYFYRDPEMPLFLLALYAKNEKADLSAKEKALWRSLVKELVRTGRRRSAGQPSRPGV